MTREITILDKFHCRKGLYVDGDAVITGDLSVNGSTVAISGGGGGSGGSGEDTELRALSANWDDTFTTVATNSSNWGPSTSSIASLTEINDVDFEYSNISDGDFLTYDMNTSMWVLTSISATESGSTESGSVSGDNAYTALTANSANWDNTLTTVSANSANWLDRIDNGTVGLTAHDPAIGSDYLHFTGHILPGAHEQYDIGSADKKIRHLFLSDNSLTIGDTKAQEAFFTSLAALSALPSQEKQVVTTPTTTTPGASAVNQILAVTELPAIQQEGVLYIVIE